MPEDESAPVCPECGALVERSAEDDWPGSREGLAIMCGPAAAILGLFSLLWWTWSGRSIFIMGLFTPVLIAAALIPPLAMRSALRGPPDHRAGLLRRAILINLTLLTAACWPLLRRLF